MHSAKHLSLASCLLLTAGLIAFLHPADPVPGVAASTVLSPAAQTAADDWPMYAHDLQHTNYNPNETLINTDNVANLVSRWQSPNLGDGGGASSGAPSVANGKVYVGSSNPTGNNYFAFDATTGSPIWATHLGYQASCEKLGIGSTAAISGTTLVVGGGDPAYYALDADNGKTLWRSELGAGPSAFAWESPLLANGRAYLGVSSYCDNPSVRGEVRAVDLASGATLNSAFFVPEDNQGAGIWNSPALSPDGATLAVVTGEDFKDYDGPLNRAMVALDPLSLAVKSANKQGPTNGDYDWGTSPVILHDDQGRTLVAAGHKDGTYYAYDLSSIDKGPIWSRNTEVRFGMMPAYDPTFGDGGTLFLVSGSGRLFAVNPANGNNRYADVAANGRGNMAIASGLIFLNDNGVLRILDETDGKLLRAITPVNSGGSNSGVAIANNFVYWLSGSYLNAWSLPAGAQITPEPTQMPVTTTITLPGTGSRLFPETGKTVTGIFLDYWNNNGGLQQQGYPISGLMSEKSPLDGKTYAVQYFERAVFEYHPENQPPYNVLLSQLGTYQFKAKYSDGAPKQQPNSSDGSMLFPETGKRLGGKFLAYWQANGGVQQQGYPISDEFVETSPVNGKQYLVQYFERAVFELHPENTAPYDVLLSLLGDLRFQQQYLR